MSEVCTIFLKGKQWGHNLNEIAFRFSFSNCSKYYKMRQISSGPFCKPNNLQYNTLGHWVDCLINHMSDGPSIILID